VLHRRVNPLQAQFFAEIASFENGGAVARKFLFCSLSRANLSRGTTKEAVMKDRFDGQSALVLAIGWVAALWLTLS
jgi:hypothetical protein